MEALINLSICKNKVGVCDSKKVVNVEVNLDTRLVLNELKNRHSAGRNISQSALASNFANNLTAHFDQLVVIVSQRIEEDRCYINV